MPRTLSALHASASWRRYQRFLVAAAPADVWREGCWRFVVFPGVLASRRVEVVFAVYLAGRGAPVRVGMLDTEADFRPRRRPGSGPLQMSNQYKKNPIHKNKVNNLPNECGRLQTLTPRPVRRHDQKAAARGAAPAKLTGTAAQPRQAG